MIKAEGGEIVYENEIETLFYQYCDDNDVNIDPKNGIDDVEAFCIWEYIYNILFKPDKDTIRYNNKRSKLDYSDIETIDNIFTIYRNLCFKFKILPMINDFCTLTGISRDTINSWERGEYRGDNRENVSVKHSDLAKKIKEATQRMTIKNLNSNPLGQQSIANNYEEAGLLFVRKEAQAQAEAWGRRPSIGKSELLGIEPKNRAELPG